MDHLPHVKNGNILSLHPIPITIGNTHRVLPIAKIKESSIAGIKTLAWHPEQPMLAAAGIGVRNYIGWVWDAHGNLLHTLNSHTNDITAIKRSPNGQRIATASRDKTVRLWTSHGACVRVITGHTAPVTGIEWSPHGDMVATHSGNALENGEIYVWGRETIKIETPRMYAQKLMWHPDGVRLVGGCNHTQRSTSSIRVWQNTGQLHYVLNRNSKIRRVAWPVDGALLAAALADNSIGLWSDTGTFLTHIAADASRTWKRPFVWHTQPPALTTIDGNTIKLWASNGELMTIFAGHCDDIASLRWSPDGHTLASGALG